jgi:hypothetical protein
VTKKRMRKWIWRAVLGTLLVVILALLAWGYSYVSPMTPRESREWSRGLIVGRTAMSRPVSLRALPDGGALLVWPDADGNLQLVVLDTGGEVIRDQIIAVDTEAARDPQVQVAPDGRLHLLWREREDPNATVRYVLTEADGTPVTAPIVLSDPAQWVTNAPRLLLDESGNAHALWASEDGIHWAVLSAEGTLREPATLVAPDGRYPAAQIDNAGRIHLAWQRQLERNNRGIYYAVIDPESGEMGEPEEVVRIFRRTGQSIEGPALGLDEQTGYVLWSIQDRREDTAEANYIYFPIDLPRQRRTQELRLVEGENPAGVWASDGQRTPLIVAASETVGQEWEAMAQVVVFALVGEDTPDYETWGMVRTPLSGRRAVLAPASPPGASLARLRRGPAASEWEVEHIVTASTQPSIKPVVVVDDRSNLHLAWLEPGGFDQYRVVYASTSAEVKDNYNTLSLWDVVNPIFTAVFRLSLIVLTSGPMMILWVVLPMGGLVVYHLITGEELLDTPRAQLALGTAITLEVVLTLVFPPYRYTAWPLLRWIAPLATAALAGLITRRTLKRAFDSPLFEVFFVFTAVHSLLVLGLYTLL